MLITPSVLGMIGTYVLADEGKMRALRLDCWDMKMIPIETKATTNKSTINPDGLLIS